MRSNDLSTNRYMIAGELATAEGFEPGKSAWWDAVRYHMKFTFWPSQSAQEHEATLAKLLAECGQQV